MSLGSFLRHLMDVVEIRFGVADVAEVILVEASCAPRLVLLLLRKLDGRAHDVGQSVALLSVAGALHGGEGTVLLFAEGGDNLLDPSCIVVAEIAQVASQGEDEGIARAMFRFAAQQLHYFGSELCIGNALVF